jgi:hypothetical protein
MECDDMGGAWDWIGFNTPLEHAERAVQIEAASCTSGLQLAGIGALREDVVAWKMSMTENETPHLPRGRIDALDSPARHWVRADSAWLLVPGLARAAGLLVPTLRREPHGRVCLCELMDTDTYGAEDKRLAVMAKDPADHVHGEYIASVANGAD